MNVLDIFSGVSPSVYPTPLGEFTRHFVLVSVGEFTGYFVRRLSVNLFDILSGVFAG